MYIQRIYGRISVHLAVVLCYKTIWQSFSQCVRTSFSKQVNVKQAARKGDARRTLLRPCVCEISCRDSECQLWGFPGSMMTSPHFNT